ncbi:MAG: hypothetical protein HOP10_01850 [Chitinophagaceae bacterium]|nr:hypothetical protein [Chitinophagaceae bacterium]
MQSHSHSLVVFFQQAFNIEQEEERLYQIVSDTGSTEQFCLAHELLDRNRITSKANKIINELYRKDVRPFRFFINKN